MLRMSVLVGICIFYSAVAITAEKENPFARDIERLAHWFEGEFDNEEQVWFHTRSGSKEDAPTRIHIINKRVDLPAFGEYVYYSEEYTNNDPDDIVRQRLVIFSADLDENAIRMRQGFFSDANAVIGGKNLEGLKTKDVLFLHDCDVFIRRLADQLHGNMKPKNCVFGEGEEERYSKHDVIFSSKKFWRVDATFLTADDSFFKGTPLDRPTELRRARVYSCDYYFYPEDGNNWPEESGIQVVEGLRVHSQGGIGTAVREIDGQVFELLIREKEYPTHSIRSDFIYYSLRREGETKSVVYGVADRASRHFGSNASHIGAFCHREGYTFNETFE